MSVELAAGIHKILLGWHKGDVRITLKRQRGAETSNYYLLIRWELPDAEREVKIE